MGLAINRDEAFRPDQAGAVVDRVAVALGDAYDKIHLELGGQSAEPIGNRPRDSLRSRAGIGEAAHRKLRKHDEVGLVLKLRLSHKRRDASKICFDVVTGSHLRDRDPRRLPRRPGLVAVQLEKVAGIPAERIGEQPRIEFGAALGKHGFAADAPRPGRVQIHVGEREAVPAIDHRRDGSVRRDHATAAAELDRTLEPPAIAFDQIAAILERPADPVGSRCTLRQPVRDMADHVGALQGDEARGLHEVDVHADQ